jgi:plasmid stabilization system protein ParE
MLSYELTPDADADLEDIARYTTLEWGPEQATLYIDKLHQGFFIRLRRSRS